MGRRPGSYPYPRRPSVEEVNRQLATEREESRKRAQRFQDRFKRAREEEAAVAEAEVTQRAREAQVTTLEAEAAEVERQEEAKNWVTEFTPQQRHEISAYETAKGRVRGDDGLGAQEKIDMLSALDRKIGSFEKIRRPRRPDEPLYPEGQDIGNTWTDESGATFTRDPSGLPKLLVRPDQTVEYLREKMQQGLEDEQRKVEEKRAAEIEKYIRDLRTERIKYDEKGTEIAKERYRTPAEVYEETLRAYPELAGPQFESVPQQVAPQQFGQLQSVPDVEPLAVQQARERKETWKRERTPHTRQEWTEVNETIRAWEKAQQEGNRQLTEAEIEKLPSGTSFIAPDGTRRRKP